MTAGDVPIPGSPSGMSRRRLLASLGGVGAVGMASGVGTVAYLTDDERFTDSDLGTGTVELLIDGAPVDGPVTLDVSGIERPDEGTAAFDLEVRANDARVWLATDCPAPDDRLAEALDVRLTVAGEAVSDGWQSFAAFRRAFVGGLRLDDGCLAPGEPLTVALRWRLPPDVDDSLADSRTSFAFRLYAEQCRHVAEAANPFAGAAPCDGPSEEHQ